MKATVVTCGPSINGPDQLWRKAMSEPCDVRIAVSYAVQYEGEFDWLCFGDLWVVEHNLKNKFVKNICTSLSWDFIRGHWHHAEKPNFVSWDALNFSTKVVCLNYSFIAALALADDLGAEEISIWGADMAGTYDFRGYAEQKTRNERRWLSESSLYKRFEAYAKFKGVVLVRNCFPPPKV